MTTIQNDRIAYFDVDETLVSILPPGVDGGTYVYGPGIEARVRPSRRHVAAILEHKARGHAVIVWSQGGYAWARAVVEALNLEPYVDAILCKPNWYYDDLKADEFMGARIYWEESDG
jgi:hypothetical protein